MDSIIQELLNHCSKYAMELLMETGELFPFGALTDAKGRTHHREVEVDKKNILSNGEIMDALLLYFEDAYINQEAMAYALVYESRVQIDETTGVDTITIDIKSKNTADIPIYYFPFRLADDQAVTFGEAFAVKRDTIS
nr:hypothetical protein [Bacteroidota bacterium]